MKENGKEERLIGSAEELNKFVYLHAPFCETSRLYDPPVPINHKMAAKADVLPGGHFVKRNGRILLSFYTMARMEEIWGKDCLEFKPERWISKGECIIHVPSFKFVAFHAGPRNCLGEGSEFHSNEDGCHCYNQELSCTSGGKSSYFDK
ncbi:hypothetical protein Patl1_02840 [Pistacia atlantica]|uniref:Uncharacterized protein n=1 Tax=Pistacia atlantica TaxID=434234 RepID=A0ACC1C946_9ROSI|nr:hypothetical protein Patl1_02840 [Pistacia atlantica]